jgi:hypothetical protein
LSVAGVDLGNALVYAILIAESDGELSVPR